VLEILYKILLIYLEMARCEIQIMIFASRQPAIHNAIID